MAASAQAAQAGAGAAAIVARVVSAGVPAPAAHLLACHAPGVPFARHAKAEQAGLPCTRHRPGYLCGGRTYHHYEPGAWGAFCDWPGFSLDAFSKDHMRVCY